jgi:hypothetical protein
MTSEKPLPDFLQKLIDQPPIAGSGVHDWLFKTSRNLHAHMPAGEIEALLRSKLATCGRVVPDREIKGAIKNSIDFAWQPKGPVTPGAAWHPVSSTPNASIAAPPPKANLAKIERLIANDDIRVADLWHQSPMWFDGEERQTEAIISLLFPGNPLLCCGKNTHDFDTKPREDWWLQLESLSFLVPSPCNAVTGLTQEGKVSKHCLANTGPRRFLVIEFDFSEYGRDGKTPAEWQPMLQRFKPRGITVQDMCANLLLRLNRVMPMTMAVSSGGKSIHGWWYCDGHPEAQVKKFHDYARTLGADRVTWTPSQFVRMPDGTRENGKPQPVLYFNPDTLPNESPPL